MPELKDGDLALVRVRHFPELVPQLARFRDIRDDFAWDDDDGEDDGLTWWQFFGSEITEPPKAIEVVARLQAFALTDTADLIVDASGVVHRIVAASDA
ncbi:hypothetical protein O7614_26535 [Micromonospora sp. WMMD961]|uniref:hypothetical protein n=1 Tax=Micromonospora sp. WMMD961 TaxID=3016100 RepID=UPI00241745D9|nr:hypothetical protein [Micromonospora sp. WMMD961]MDG4783222.1 hypothetical protein [Micromonospora sp. WMMD961]